MVSIVLVMIGGILPCLWGITHIFPLKGVVNDFGEISIDNKRILQMEWLTEAITLIFIGVVIFAILLIGEPASLTARVVYGVLCFKLLSMTILSLFTGFKINFFPYKLCPIFFGSAMVCLFIGGIIL